MANLGIDLLGRELMPAGFLPVADVVSQWKTTDFVGSLEFIDSLPSSEVFKIRRSNLGFSILPRDTADIATSSNARGTRDILSDVREGSLDIPFDNRYFNPMTDYDPGELQKGAGRVVEEWVPYIDPERPDRRYRVNKETGEIVYVPRTWNKGDVQQGRFVPGFQDALRVAICAKRKLRRLMMFARGKAGFFYRVKHPNPWSWVRC